MKHISTRTWSRGLLIASVAAIAVLALPMVTNMVAGDFTYGGGPAWADDDGDGGKGKMGQGAGGDGQKGKGANVIGQGQGQGGPGEDSDAKGPRAGMGKPDGGSGGKPVWAQEGIPEIELGRLNVARAPAHVIQRSLDEALANFTTEMEALYEMTAEAAAALLVADYDNVLRIDSPLENLGIYKDVLVDGVTQLPGVTPASVIDLAAIALGGASDKTVPISTDTVTAINTILGITMSEADVSTLAEKAEAVRAAVLLGHGE